MHGAVYGVLLLGAALVVGLLINPIIAIVLVMLAAIVFGLLGGGKVLREAKVGAGPGPAGVPTTRDASYEPVSDPRSHPST